jgi:hypothetical protein
MKPYCLMALQGGVRIAAGRFRPGLSTGVLTSALGETLVGA